MFAVYTMHIQSVAEIVEGQHIKAGKTKKVCYILSAIQAASYKSMTQQPDQSNCN